MSGMNSKPVSSLLPDDIESQLALAKNKIFTLSEQRKSLDSDIESKKIIQGQLDAKLLEINNEIARINASNEARNSELNEKERRLSQKESALDVYANALEEKEKKIKKYLTVFENMKDVIS